MSETEQQTDVRYDYAMAQTSVIALSFIDAPVSPMSWEDDAFKPERGTLCFTRQDLGTEWKLVEAALHGKGHDGLKRSRHYSSGMMPEWLAKIIREVRP